MEELLRCFQPKRDSSSIYLSRYSAIMNIITVQIQCIHLIGNGALDIFPFCIILQLFYVDLKSIKKQPPRHAIYIPEELFVLRHPASISADRVARFVVLWVSGFYEVLEFCDVCGIRNLGYCYAVSATVCVIIADSQGEPFSGGITARCFLLIQIIRAIRQFINEVDTVDSAFEGRGCGTINIDTATLLQNNTFNSRTT